jgi:hypothetical protein
MTKIVFITLAILVALIVFDISRHQARKASALETKRADFKAGFLQALEAAEADNSDTLRTFLKAQYSFGGISRSSGEIAVIYKVKDRWTALYYRLKEIDDYDSHQTAIRSSHEALTAAFQTGSVLGLIAAAVSWTETSRNCLISTRIKLADELGHDQDEMIARLRQIVGTDREQLVRLAPRSSKSFYALQALLMDAEKDSEANMLLLLEPLPYPKDWNLWVAMYMEYPTFEDFAGIRPYSDTLTESLILQAGAIVNRFRKTGHLEPQDVVDALIIITLYSPEKDLPRDEALAILVAQLSPTVAAERTRFGWTPTSAPAFADATN